MRSPLILWLRRQTHYLHGQAFVAAEKILSTFNCHDRTLRKWPKQGSTRGMQALGFSGMSANRLGQYRPKFIQLNTYPENRRSHYLGPHLKNPRFMSAYCCIAFGGINIGVPVAGTRVDMTEPAVPAEPAVPMQPAIAPKKEGEPTLAEPPVDAPKADEAKTSGQDVRSGKSRKSARQSLPSGSRTGQRRGNGVASTRG